MIDARDHWTQKKHWPIKTRFIGTAGIKQSKDVEKYQRKCRFHLFDNIEYAVDRVMAIKYLNQCYEEGYTKDVVFTGPNCYGRRGVKTY